jgi:hypothetical protein
MGIYDTFHMEAPCWKCGKVLDDWQTKQLDPCMHVYKKGDRIRSINIIEGTIDVYTCCRSPSVGIFNIKTGEQYGVSEEEQAKYCDTWNNAAVHIKNGVVDSIEVCTGTSSDKDD